MKSFRICIHNIRKWKGNSKIIIVMLMVFLFTLIFTKGIWGISDILGEQINPWIFPFMMSQRYMRIILLFPLILIFCDAPFIDDNHQFVMIRVKRSIWGLGQIMYIMSTSLIYLLFLFASSILTNLGHIKWGTDWGKVLVLMGTSNIAGKAGAGVQYSTIRVVGRVVKYFTPIQAMLFTLLLGWLCCVMLGLLVYDLNMIFKSNLVGVFSAGLLILFTTFADWNHKYMKFSPVSWCNLSNIDVGNMTDLPSIDYVLVTYFIIIIILIIVGLIVGKRYSFEVKK